MNFLQLGALSASVPEPGPEPASEDQREADREGGTQVVPLLFFSWQNPFTRLSAVQQPWEIVSSHTPHPVLTWLTTPSGPELYPYTLSVLPCPSHFPGLSNSVLYFLPFAFLFVLIFVQWHGLKYICTCPSRADSNATSPRKPALLSPVSYKKSSLLIGTVC